MTDKEKAIVMAHTGICMLTGNKFQIFHKYVEDIMERPIMTHEIGWLENTIKEKTKADFIALCMDESNSENPNKWIPISERLPKNSGVYIVSRWFSDGIESVIITDACYFDGAGTWYNDNRINHDREYLDKKIVAWMPLPESYKAENETEQSLNYADQNTLMSAT